MAPFYGWGSTALRLEPPQGGKETLMASGRGLGGEGHYF